MSRMLVIFSLWLMAIVTVTGVRYTCDPTSSCGCSTSSTALSRIIGGEPALDRSWSWIVSLRIDHFHSCGATVLSPLFVITGTHCVNDTFDLSSLSILAGSSTLDGSSTNSTPQIRSISRVYSYADYDPSSYANDITLLRLSAPLNLVQSRIKPICLPPLNVRQPLDNVTMVAIGWGATTSGSSQSSPILRQVTLQSISHTSKDCLKQLANDERQFCAGVLAGGKGQITIRSSRSTSTFLHFRHVPR